MSIERFGNIYTPTCDYCGNELVAEFDFYDAVAAKKRAGWRSRQDKFGWSDYCDDCWRDLCWD